MLTKILIVLAIIPWSLIFGVSYLVYRRVRGQQKFVMVTNGSIGPSVFDEYSRGSAQDIADFYFDGVPDPITEQKPLEGWKTADADYVAKMGRA